MSSPAERTALPVEAFDEKQFYLDEFRSRTLLFSLAVEDLQREEDYARLANIARELLTNDTRVIVLLSTADVDYRRAFQKRKYCADRPGI